MFQDKLNRVLNAMKDAGLEQMIVAYGKQLQFVNRLVKTGVPL